VKSKVFLILDSRFSFLSSRFSFLERLHQSNDVIVDEVQNWCDRIFVGFCIKIKCTTKQVIHTVGEDKLRRRSGISLQTIKDSVHFFVFVHKWLLGNIVGLNGVFIHKLARVFGYFLKVIFYGFITAINCAVELRIVNVYPIFILIGIGTVLDLCTFRQIEMIGICRIVKRLVLVLRNFYTIVTNRFRRIFATRHKTRNNQQ